VKYRDFVKILEINGFLMKPRTATSHRHYEAIIEGKRRLVTISCEDGDDVGRNNLSSMIRQSGLPKRLFR
jgi:predicted RNA binding protein YcfA (HicA-like mRNA interferase family)